MIDIDKFEIVKIRSYEFKQHGTNYKISREKLEPEPGFEPRTSGYLARRSTT